MVAAQEMVQVNVRMPRALKEQGDATLALMGSSPAKIIRQLWAKLAQGGDAYLQVEQSFDEHADQAEVSPDVASRLERSTHLFQKMGESLGLDISTFVPSTGNPYELLEEEDWSILVEKGLA